ncbi:Hsp33 family molecular chaperone HslO [Alphaproteobacteria bacterium]|nr:Hsp33 family molecular chaperone HslO [Alphaproteobacteria bacterium]
MEYMTEKNNSELSDDYSELPPNSFVIPFYLTGGPQNKTPKIIGRICRLVPPIQQILDRHHYPDSVNSLLAEAMVITSCLSTTFKLDGVITLQAKGEGPIKTLFCDVSNDGHIRSYAAYDEQEVEQISKQKAEIPEVMGEGYMAFTIEQNGPNQRYQGIVDLSGKTVADAVTTWFKNSEQVHTEFITKVQKQDGEWIAATLMLQKIADTGGIEDDTGIELADIWSEAKIFAQSVTENEFLDPALELETLLYRLFHELGIYIQPKRPIIDKCRCSDEKVETMLRSIHKDELQTLADENGDLVVDCEFCKKIRIFSANLKAH